MKLTQEGRESPTARVTATEPTTFLFSSLPKFPWPGVRFHSIWQMRKLQPGEGKQFSQNQEACKRWHYQSTDQIQATAAGGRYLGHPGECQASLGVQENSLTSETWHTPSSSSSPTPAPLVLKCPPCSATRGHWPPGAGGSPGSSTWGQNTTGRQ